MNNSVYEFSKLIDNILNTFIIFERKPEVMFINNLRKFKNIFQKQYIKYLFLLIFQTSSILLLMVEFKYLFDVDHDEYVIQR